MDLNNKTTTQLKVICKKKPNKKTKRLKKLVKKIKNNKLEDLLNKYNDPGKKGYLYEKLWDIIIKCGCCPKFNNSLFHHMDGNINLGKMDHITNLEYYFKKNKILSKNKGGSSDVTLQKNDGTWIFISSKFYKDDSKKSIKDYEIQDILKEIHEHSYKKYEIWLVVNDKRNVQKIIQSSQHTNDTISKNINGILDLNDLKKYYVHLQKELQEINLDNKGELNNRFCNSMERFQERFHQDLMTSQTLKRISEGEKKLLWGWKCRAGKTFGVGALLLKYYKKFNKCNCLIITPAPTETISQFVNDMFIRYRDFNQLNIIEVKSGKELKSLIFKKNNIIICSKQLLDDYITEDTKIQKIIDLNLDLIIFDENHFGGCSQLSKDIISIYSYKNTTKLFLSATFQKPLLEWNIPQHCQFYWNIEDEQLCKKRNIKGLVEKHGDEVLDFINEDNKEEKLTIYDKMPDLELITTIMDPHRYNLIREQIKDTKFGFSMEVLFSLTKHNKFKFPKEVENILSYISGSSIGAVKDKKSIFERIKTISRNQDSRTTLCNEKFTTQLWFLPFGPGMKINNVSKCLKRKMLNDQILKDYEIMIINSHKEDKLKDLKGNISKKELNAKKDGKLGLILLAGTQCSLGITLPLCDIVVLLNNTLSVDRILQMMYRCMSESSDGSKKCGFVVDLNISRVLNTLLEYNINKKDTTTQDKFTYLIENNLINIDSDLFVGKEKKNNYGVKLVNKLLDIWKSDPINHHKTLLKKIENLAIELDVGDQKILNKYFTLSGKTNETVVIKLDDNDQDLPSGKEMIKEDGKEEELNKEEQDDEDEKYSITISLTKDILPFIIPLSCILTIGDNQMDFIQMLDNIKQNKELLEVFNTQSTIWWNKKDIIELISKVVKKYIKKNSEPYNIAIHFKMSLQSLIDRPKELLDLINSCLKPKKIEKKKYGEVFTPMNGVNEMLDKLDYHYKDDCEQSGKSIFEEKDFKWLDPANGMGNFPIAVYYRLMDGLKGQIQNEEERKKHILENMLYMSEFNKKNIFISRQIFDIKNKYRLNIYHGDSLKLDTEKEWGVKKFDVIMGNPPYQRNKATGDNKLYLEFLKYCLNILKENKYILFITPTNVKNYITNQPKNRKYINEYRKILYLNINTMNKYFPNVGTYFSVFLIKNTIVKKCKTNVEFMRKNKIVTDCIEITEGQKLPLCISKRDIDIINKTSNILHNNNDTFGILKALYEKKKNKFTHQRIRKCHIKKGDIMEEENNSFKYKIIDKINKGNPFPGIYYYNNYKMINHGKPKIIMCTGGYLMPSYDKNGEYNISDNMIYMLCETEEEYLNFEKLINSKIIKYLNKITMTDNIHGRDIVISNIKKISLKNIDNDAEIYNRLGLTIEDIKIINETI